MRPFGWIRDSRVNCACGRRAADRGGWWRPRCRRAGSPRRARSAPPPAPSSRAIAVGQVLALALAGFLAAEFEPVDVGLRREAAGARDQPAQRLAGQQLVDAGRIDLAFERHQAGLARHRHADVLLAVDRHDVAGLQQQVVDRVVVQHGLAEVERDHLRCSDPSGSAARSPRSPSSARRTAPPAPSSRVPPRARSSSRALRALLRGPVVARVVDVARQPDRAAPVAQRRRIVRVDRVAHVARVALIALVERIARVAASR